MSEPADRAGIGSAALHQRQQASDRRTAPTPSLVEERGDTLLLCGRCRVVAHGTDYNDTIVPVSTVSSPS